MFLEDLDLCDSTHIHFIIYLTKIKDPSGKKDFFVSRWWRERIHGMEENRVERIRGRSVAILAVNADTARGELCQINNPPKARAQLASVVVLLARDVTSSKTLLLPGPVHPPPPH